MSLKTWKEEFYPIPVKEVEIEDAVQHSLTKWNGLTKTNIKKHGGHKFDDENYITFEDGDFTINEKTCALCRHYIDDLTECLGCPLAKVLGHRCDNGDVDEDKIMDTSVYHEFLNNNNPKPMIAALKRALRLQKKEDKCKSS